MVMRDRTFQRVFSKTFVYNILFEDAEVDERYLGLDATSTVLGISGAGCGIAGMVSANPRRVDAVDINHHHLALAALKATAARELDSYEDFYDLLGRGWHVEPERVVGRVAEALPARYARYWRRHDHRFERTLYHQGLTAKMLRAVRKHAGLDASWLRSVALLPEADRMQAVRDILAPLAANAGARCVLGSPVQLLALGINFQQRDRLVASEQQTMVEYFVTHLVRLAQTDVARNWFAWYGAAGHFNHDDPDAVPPYLRRSRWARSVEADTELAFHHGNIFDVLGGAGARTWSHYTLCDAVDWMPEPVQQRLFAEIRRTARPGAVVLWRSVEDVDLPQRLGISRWLERMPVSDAATEQDRSRQYRQVNFYQVTA
ncbi:MAG: DUF3419 family protein [Alphaproteobacteria bacterium]|nr:DUF3419 family protein [Alphaproteobacteria bacterium]